MSDIETQSLSGTTVIGDDERPPVSPRTAAHGLQIALRHNDYETINVIAQGLLGTVRKREEETRQVRQAYENEVRQLQHKIQEQIQLLQQRHTTTETPSGFAPNADDRAPDFAIPMARGLYKVAHWVKFLSDGRVAGYPEEYAEGDPPYIADIYPRRQPYDDDDQRPVLPLPTWTGNLLRGNATNYSALLRKVEKEGRDWGLTAEVIRYRALEHAACDLRLRIQHLQAELQGVAWAQTPSRGRLEEARLDDVVYEVRTLADPPARQGRRRPVV